MTRNEPEDVDKLPAELMHDDILDHEKETKSVTRTDSLTIDEILESEVEDCPEQSNSEILLQASERIYIFQWISKYFIGNSVTRAKMFALSFVGSGFKTLILLLVLVFTL